MRTGRFLTQLAVVGMVMAALVMGLTPGSAQATATCFGQAPTFSCTIAALPGLPAVCNNGGPAAGNVTFCDGDTTIDPPPTAGLIIVGDCENGFGQASDDVVVGTSYQDVIVTGQGNDTVCALGGNDVIDGGDNPDLLDGGAGNDCISGGNGDDRIFGQGGNDVLFGNGGFDTLNGGAGTADICVGGPGFDGFAGCETRVQGTPAEP